MWDERYAEEGLAYGDAANDFLVQQVSALQPGNCLCLAEGQGRNATWLAQQGFDVTAVDQSATGLAAARDFAAQRGVSIRTEVADLADYDLGEARWDNMVSIFAHMPSVVRKALHSRVARGLKPGGVFLLEAYTPETLQTSGMGGPKEPDLLMTLESLREELQGLEFRVGREIRRDVNEGKYHRGEGAVVQVIARKPEGE
ncbi:class I SAM-dependent methyltransferase [Altericroceibacterium spongiae]|uniref:Class I SAM-dependent methyltransferase n=1 Tax=Altericroceibacterium spongiae TaxID=2320269 RepID=A0A420EF40_9SPHN|nr:class I SAM-dependent methyltransferase [Altericroceibacterium spongiae]RKF19274.1 class I SAM-dependent methyltransferase [Altericroceibacterium spongiae]